MFRKNTAVTGFTVGFINTTTGAAVTTGTPTGTYTLDGGVQAAIAGAFTHEGNGLWSVNLTAGEMNGTIVGLTFSLTNAINVFFTIKTVLYDPDNATTLGLTNLDAAVTTRMATYTQPTGFLAATFPATVASTTNITAGTVTTATNVTTLNGIAANVITAASIADGAIDNSTFAADTGQKTIRSSTAQAGAATSITLDASASAVTDFYKNALIVLTGGTGAGQGRYCTAYNGTTKVATVSTWATNPDVTSTFAIIAADAIVGATAPTAVQVADEVQTRTIAAVTVVNGLAANTVTAAALATDAVTEIQAGLATPTNITAGTITTVTNLTNAPTAGDLTATMKTSVTTAATAATPVAASVTGAVGSVTAGVTVTTNNDKTGYALTQTFPANFAARVISAGGTAAADITAVAGATATATKLSRVLIGNVTGTVGAASTTTSIVTSALDPAASVADQYKGRIVTFGDATTTAALRGQSTDITANTSGGVLTVTALTTAAVSGDTFTIS